MPSQTARERAIDLHWLAIAPTEVEGWFHMTIAHRVQLEKKTCGRCNDGSFSRWNRFHKGTATF